MADYILEAQPREERGRHVKALRRQGAVPAVLYGHNVEPVALSADARQLERIWQRAGRTHLVSLRVEGSKALPVLIKAYQHNPRTGGPQHADLYAVNVREKLTTQVPIVPVGESPAVKNGIGQLQQPHSHIEVECLPGDIPAQISVDISGLEEVDQSVTIGQLELPKGVTLLHSEADEVVVKIAAPRISTADVEADEAEQSAASAESGAAAAAAEA